MKEYNIPCGNRELKCKLPSNRVIFCTNPVEHAEIPDQEKTILDSLNNPVNATTLDSLDPSKRVAIIVDDITRPTPVKEILPFIIKLLKRAGIKDENIKIVIALGTHRQMTEKELSEKLGNEIFIKYKIINIDYRDKSNFIEIGMTKSNIPIEIYKEVYYSDYKIGIGNITPHVTAGWGGGAKIIQPGICGESATEYTHLLASLNYSAKEICGVVDNGPRGEMEEIASLVGLDFIVNTVLDENKNILGVFSGHYIDAHRKGVRFAESVMCPLINEPADIVVVSANPCERDFWQGYKPLAYALSAVKEKGTIIFVFDAPEGISGNAPKHEETLKKWTLKPFEELKEIVLNRQEEDLIGLTQAIDMSKLLPLVNVICISPNLSVEDKILMGFRHASLLEDAIKEASEIHGENSTIGIIPFGGETLVRIKK